jgi:uncharacterized protein YwgA
VSGDRAKEYKIPEDPRWKLLLDDLVAPVLRGDLIGASATIGGYHVQVYRVRGKGWGGRDCARVDITPLSFPPRGRPSPRKERTPMRGRKVPTEREARRTKGELRWLADFVGAPLKRIKEEGGLEERLRLQKAAFLLKHLGVAPFASYRFDAYLHGPYSSTLTRGLHRLEEDTKPAKPNLDRREEKLLRWFLNHDDRWLEIASSIISLRERYPDAPENEIYSILTMSKPWVERGRFSRIYQRLEGRGVIGGNP